MPTNPIVSVVMPAYNVELYVEEAVRSILNQTFCDFEFIIVDDGSTDRTPEILRTFTDPRIRLLFNEKNEGNYPARNRGCRLARGKYIAVMDADDVALPERLEKQVRFMEEYPEVLACGTAYRLMGENRSIVEPTEWVEIRYILMSTFCMSHPTILFRADTMRQVGFYRTDSRYAEDYDLALRLARLGKIVNLPDILLERRRHQEQISSRYRIPQNAFAEKVQLRYQHENGIYYPPVDPELFLSELAAYLRSTVSYVLQGGLYAGRLGLVLFFYHYADYAQKTEFREVADRMLETILSGLNADMPVDIGYGLCGIGFLLSYLMQKGFVEGEPDEVLEEVDRMVVERTDFDNEDWSFETGLTGVIYYVAYRVESRTPSVQAIYHVTYLQRLCTLIDKLEHHPDWACPYQALLENCKQVLQGGKFVMDWNVFWRKAIGQLPTATAFGRWSYGLFGGGAGWGLNWILKLDI